jgi:hypothetical protein
MDAKNTRLEKNPDVDIEDCPDIRDVLEVWEQNYEDPSKKLDEEPVELVKQFDIREVAKNNALKESAKDSDSEDDDEDDEEKATKKMLQSKNLTQAQRNAIKRNKRKAKKKMRDLGAPKKKDDFEDLTPKTGDEKNSVLHQMTKEELAAPLSQADAELYNKLVSMDDKKLSAMSQQELDKASKLLTRVRYQTNPFSFGFPKKDEYMTLAILHSSRDWLEKELMCTFISYLFVACNEWHAPNGIPAVNPEDYYRDPKILDYPEMSGGAKPSEQMVKDYEETKAFMKNRMIVRRFLLDQFQFDPSEHVRSAYAPNPADPERQPIRTIAAQLATRHRRAAVERRRRKNLEESKFRDDCVEYVEREFWALEDEQLKERIEAEIEKMKGLIEKQRKKMQNVQESTKKVVVKRLDGNLVKKEFDWQEGEKENTLRQIGVFIVDSKSRLRILKYKLYKLVEKCDPVEAEKLLADDPEVAEIGVMTVDELKSSDPILDVMRKEKLIDDEIKAIEKEVENTPVEEPVNLVVSPNKIDSDVPAATSAIEEKADEKADEKEERSEAVATTTTVVAVKKKAPILPLTDDPQERYDYIKEMLSRQDVDPKRILREIIPPSDIFARINRYHTKHIKAIRQLVTDLYACKPDITDAILAAENHVGPDAAAHAANFQDKYKDTMPLDLYTLQVGAWSIIGPYAKNNERTFLYSKNSKVLDRMVAESVDAKKLLKQMTAKMKLRQKRKMGKKDVPDLAKQWMKQKQVESGLNDELSEDDDDISIDKDDEELPDDTLEIPVWTNSADGKGMVKRKFYVEAGADKN